MKKTILAMTLALTLASSSFLGFLPGKSVMAVEAAEAGLSTVPVGTEGTVGGSETTENSLTAPTVLYWIHGNNGIITEDGVISINGITNGAIPVFNGEEGKQYEVEIWLNGEIYKTVSGTADSIPDWRNLGNYVIRGLGGVLGWRVESGEVVRAMGWSYGEEGIYQFRVREFSTDNDGNTVYSDWSEFSSKCDNTKESMLAYLESVKSGSDNNDSESNAADSSTDSDDNDNATGAVTASSGEMLTSSAAINVTGTTPVVVRTPQSMVTAAATTAVGSLKEGQYVMVTVGDSQCGEQARQAVTNAASSVNGIVVSYLEITLDIYNPEGGVDRNVEQMTTSIEFTVAAPTDIDGNQYDFAVVRLHGDGKADILPDLDNDPATITFKTDRFSVYAVIYGPKGSFSRSGKDRVPKTGDSTVPVLPFAMAGTVCVAAAIVLNRKTQA